MYLKSIIWPFLVAIAAVGAAICVTILCTIVVITLPYRLLVWGLAKVIRPNLTSFITGLSSVFMLDSYEKPTLNLVSIKIIHGRIELEQMRDLMQKRLIEKRDENGVYVYSRLFQCAANFMGYSFWQKDNNFSINNHVRLYDYTQEDLRVPSPCFEEDLRRIMGGLLAAPWKDGHSPWEFLLIHNYRPEGDTSPEVEKMALVCRFHHGIGDGHSSSKLLTDMGLNYTPAAMPTPIKKPLWAAVLLPLIYPFKFCYDLADNYLMSVDSDNPWHRQGIKLSKTYFTSFTKPIPVSLVKEIKNKHGVSYISVLYAAVGGGISRIMAQAGQTPPKFMACLNPVPKPDHPGGMINHMMWVNTILSIQAESPVQRLQKIQENLSHLKLSLAPVASDVLIQLVGQLPARLRRMACWLVPGTLMASNFPGPSEPPIFEGHLVPDLIFGCGTWEVKCGANIFMIGLAGKQRVVINIDKNLFPSEKLFQKLGRYIEEEFEILSSQCINPRKSIATVV